MRVDFIKKFIFFDRILKLSSFVPKHLEAVLTCLWQGWQHAGDRAEIFLHDKISSPAPCLQNNLLKARKIPSKSLPFIGQGIQYMPQPPIWSKVWRTFFDLHHRMKGTLKFFDG